MAKKRNTLYCEECGEFINGEDFMSCDICDAPIHIWCAVRMWCENQSGEYFCKDCAEELEKKDDCLKF